LDHAADVEHHDAVALADGIAKRSSSRISQGGDVNHLPFAPTCDHSRKSFGPGKGKRSRHGLARGQHANSQRKSAEASARVLRNT
jgi:hypothetical protein